MRPQKLSYLYKRKCSEILALGGWEETYTGGGLIIGILRHLSNLMIQGMDSCVGRFNVSKRCFHPKKSNVIRGGGPKVLVAMLAGFQRKFGSVVFYG